MTMLDIIAVLLVLAVAFGCLNHLVLKLPNSIGLVVIALAASGGVVLLDQMLPVLGVADTVRTVLLGIDFYEALMEGFLSALLFAGAVHVDLSEIARRKWAILLMATLGVLTSTFLVAAATWLVAGLVGIALPFAWALVFGALISPTDPVAVLAILKTVKVPASLKAKIAGESLFNDGVGVVVFTIMLAFASGAGGSLGSGETIGFVEIASLFVAEAFGGAALGLAAGYIAFVMMRSLDEHKLEVLITLALVTGVYALALRLHMSGPIAVVVAGLLIGNHGAQFAMSDKTREHVFNFWELTDEILNSVLFLLIGLEVLVIGFTYQFSLLALMSIPIVLAARFVAVALPIGILRIRETFTEGAITVLTWGGLRGGISVALALSLPVSPYKAPILAVTYAVVVFSIVIQGLTIGQVIRRVLPNVDEDRVPGQPEPNDVIDVAVSPAAPEVNGDSAKKL